MSKVPVRAQARTRSSSAHTLHIDVTKGQSPYKAYMEELAGNEELAKRMAPKQKAAYKAKRDIDEWYNRAGRAIITQIHEQKVFQFIVARTLQYGKFLEAIPASHFINGVINPKTGGYHTAPSGVGNSYLAGALKRLYARGVLVKVKVTGAGANRPNVLGIAIDFTLSLQLPGDKMPALRQPRKTKLTQNDKKTAEIVVLADFMSRKTGNRVTCLDKQPPGFELLATASDRNKESKPERSKLLPPPPAQQSESILATPKRVRRTPRPAVPTKNEIDYTLSAEDVISAVQGRVAGKRMQRISDKPADATVTMHEVNSTWQQAMITAHDVAHVEGINPEGLSRLRNSVKTGSRDFTWLSFFTWCATNWAAIESNAQEEARRRRSRDGDNSPSNTTVFLGSRPCIWKVAVNAKRLIDMYLDQNGFKVGTHNARAKVDDATAAELAALQAENKILAAYVHNIKEAHRKDIADLRRSLSTKVESSRAVPQKRIKNPELDTDFDDDDDLPEWKNDE